jgi:hypothetical protein
MSHGAWVYVISAVGGILLFGSALFALARLARRTHEKLGLQPIRRHKSWLVDLWLDAKEIRSQKEFWFGPLPILLSSFGRALAMITIIAVIGVLLVIVVAVLTSES